MYIYNHFGSRFLDPVPLASFAPRPCSDEDALELQDSDADGDCGWYPAPLLVLNCEVLIAVPCRGGALHET